MYSTSLQSGVLKHGRLVEWAMLGAIVFCGALISAYFAWSEQRLADAIETSRMGAQVRIVDKNLRYRLKALRSALDSVRDNIAIQGQGCRAGCDGLRLDALRRAMPGVRALAVIDREGRLLERDGNFDPTQVDPRAVIRELSAMSDQDQLDLLLPTIDATWPRDIEVALPLPAQTGGAVMAILHAEYFADILQSVLYAPDMQGAITQDGGRRLLRIPSPGRPTGTGPANGDASLIWHIDSAQSAAPSDGYSSPGQDERIMVQHSLLPANTGLDRTLVISVSRSRDELRRPSQHLIYAYATAWLVLALASVALLLNVQWRRHLLLGRSERRRAERAAEAERMNLALDGAGLGVWEWDLAANLLRLDSRGAAMIGYTTDHRGANDDWMEGVHPDDRAMVEQCLARHLNGQAIVFEVDHRQRHANGSWIWIHSRGKVVERGADGQARRMAGTREDISVRKKAQADIQHLAFFDSLTDLPNRRLLCDRLRHSLVKSARQRRAGAILFVDLDNFKNMNETLGHDMGDRLLQQVALRLRDITRDADTVARLGGDEFVILLEELDNFGGKADERAALVADKVLVTLTTPYLLEGHEVHVTPSIGIAVFGEQEREAEELLKQADMAMYDAKAAGRNTFRFFAPMMQVTLDEQARLESDFRHAVRRDELLLHFQPIVDETGRSVAAEALVRWRHPERGLLGPSQFIPVAERSGLILSIGQWVLEQACEQMARWAREANGNVIQVAVNISANQFRQENFVDQVLQALRRSHGDPRNLKIELTESILLHNVEDVIAKMTVLKAHGVHFSLDDFGTGYSSLSYLQRLPLDQLKIDKSFVQDMLTSKNAASIVSAIIGMAHSLQMDVVAEGVETEPQRKLLAAFGCRLYQGYLIGKPMPAEKLSPSGQRIVVSGEDSSLAAPVA